MVIFGIRNLFMKFFRFFFFITVLTFGQSDYEKTEKYLANKEFVKAQNLMAFHVNRYPNDLKGIELLGDAYGYQKRWDEAIENYKTLVDLRPNTANYHYKYGGALGMKALSISKIKAVGIIGDVKEAFITAAELDPNHIETRWALVKLYMQLPGIFGGSMSKALKYADELQNLSKVDGYLAKGYIYEYDKELAMAEKYYKLAIMEGGSLICYEKLTNLYINKKQPNKAISNMEASYNIHKNNLLNYQIGKVSGDYNVQLEKGEVHLQAYIRKFSEKDEMPVAWANYRLAQIYKHRLKKSEALIYIDLAIEELPKEDLFKKEKSVILSLR